MPAKRAIRTQRKKWAEWEIDYVIDRLNCDYHLTYRGATKLVNEEMKRRGSAGFVTVAQVNSLIQRVFRQQRLSKKLNNDGHCSVCGFGPH